MKDFLVDRNCSILDGHCNCECPESDCKYSGKPFPKNPCVKEQMTVETCRYNPRLGCDCGYHKPNYHMGPVKTLIEAGLDYHPYDNRPFNDKF